jgi:flagellar basal-body rod protein FlgF/flagellar basal-body rod protein FlgG
MDSGYYAALTGLIARGQALDAAAANLSNAQTPGYRAERAFFRSTLLGPDSQDSQLGQTVNNYGLLGGDTLNFAQGALEQTGNALDLALEGQGFFAIQTANGLRYTRDGSFHRSPKGLLVTASNEPVLSTTGQLVTIPPGEISIAGNGVLSVGGGVVATVGISVFASGTALTAEGANRYIAPEGTTQAQATATTIRQGSIEASNQDVVQGTLDLIVMQRQAEMMQKALTTFHVDFNKFATEDLPRV